MLYNGCTGIYKFGNNTYPRRIGRRWNLSHILRENKCVLWAGKYGNKSSLEFNKQDQQMHLDFDIHRTVHRDMFL